MGNFWHALDAARVRQLAIASPQDVYRYAQSEQQTLVMLRQPLSMPACGRYASGIAIRLGNRAEAFADTVAPGYLARFSGNDTVQWPAKAWHARMADALRRHRAERCSPHGELAGETHRSTHGTRQLATLDQLPNAPKATDDLALRAYLLAR